MHVSYEHARDQFQSDAFMLAMQNGDKQEYLCSRIKTEQQAK